MYVQIIGWMGLILLILTYAVLLSKKTSSLFILLNIPASALLTIYAILNHDAVFICVNGFITSVLIYRLIKGDIIK